MNKKLLLTIGMAVLALTLVTAGVALAQTQTPPGPGYGPGMMGGYGRGGMMGGSGMTRAPARGAGVGGQFQPGWMHDVMLDTFAAALGLDRATLEERLANGETMYQIATAEGLSQDEFFALMTQARQTAIAQAVEDGTLTQAQADWMLSHMAGGMRGYGRGMMGNNGACPFHNTAPTP